MGHEETIMRQWLDVCFTEGGLMVAQQKLHKRPLLVAQMLEEWLNHYRRIAWVSFTSDPYTFHIPPSLTCQLMTLKSYSSPQTSHLTSIPRSSNDRIGRLLIWWRHRWRVIGHCKFLTYRPLPPKRIRKV